MIVILITISDIDMVNIVQNCFLLIEESKFIIEFDQMKRCKAKN